MGYEAACLGRTLTLFNGARVLSLRDLAARVASATRGEPFLRFTFGKYTAVLESSECRRLDPIVLRAHDIPSWCSANVDPRASAAPRAPCVTAWFECLGLGGCGGGAKTEPGAESPVEMVPAR